MLDRNGLRPSRYLVTKDGLVVMASETGVLDIPPEQVEHKGRLQPGKMFLVDTVCRPHRAGRGDQATASRRASRIGNGSTKASGRPGCAAGAAVRARDQSAIEPLDLLKQQQAFGYTLEDLKMLLAPMAVNGQEPVGSMGTDTPLAVLSDKSPLLFNYFKQLFAQVTNPPIDPIREEMVMSAETTIGAEQNLFEETPMHCRQLRLKKSDSDQRASWRRSSGWRSPACARSRCSTLFRGGRRRRRRCARRSTNSVREASQAIADGYTIIVLSDRGVNARMRADSEPARDRRRASSSDSRRHAHASAASWSSRASRAK